MFLDDYSGTRKPLVEGLGFYGSRNCCLAGKKRKGPNTRRSPHALDKALPFFGLTAFEESYIQLEDVHIRLHGRNRDHRRITQRFTDG